MSDVSKDSFEVVIGIPKELLIHMIHVELTGKTVSRYLFTKPRIVVTERYAKLIDTYDKSLWCTLPSTHRAILSSMPYYNAGCYFEFPCSIAI